MVDEALTIAGQSAHLAMRYVLIIIGVLVAATGLGFLFMSRSGDESTNDWERLWDARLAALEAVLGPSTGGALHASIPFNLDGAADVVEFLEHVDGVVYVTADLIGDDRSKPNDLGQYELMICLRDEADWAPQLISNLAKYTIDAVLQPGETMDIAPALPQPTNLSSFLFGSYATISVQGKPASILLCVGITGEELQYLQANGYDALLQRLKDAGVFPFTDLSRRSVVSDG